MRRTLPPADNMFADLKDDLKKVAGHQQIPPAAASRRSGTLAPLRQTQMSTSLEIAHVKRRDGAQSVPLISSSTHRNRSQETSLALTTTHDHRSSALRAVDVPLPVFTSEFDVPIESQKQTLSTWMGHYFKEMSDVESTIVASELLLQQINDAVLESSNEYSPDKPHALRLAAVCTVAECLCETLGRHRSVLRPVLDEIYRSLYLPPGRGVPKDELAIAKMVALGLRPKESVYLQRFLARKTFFEEAEHSQVTIGSLKMQIVALSSAKASGKTILDRLGDNWRSTVLRMLFLAWRGAASKSKAQNSVMSKYLSLIQRKDKLQTHFYAWRLVVKEMLLLQARQQYSNSLEQLVQQEATTHVKYLEVEDQLAESKMIVTRLKVEKDMHRLEKDKMQQVIDSALGQAEGWRRMTTEVVTFLGTLKKYMATPKSVVVPAKLSAVTEQVHQTLLTWAGRLVGPLPIASKCKMTNFGTDMRDGALLVMLVHVLTNGEVDLKILADYPDVRGRLQVVLDAINGSLGITLPFSIDDVFPLTPEMNFFLLFTLWCHFEAPPVPSAETSMGMTGGYRDDIDATTKYVEAAKSFYPTWLDRRNVLQQYAQFVLFAKLKNVPPSALSEFETAERDRDASQFSIQDVSAIPSAFLSAVNLSPAQKFQNEEERVRTNAVLSKHIGLLRQMFERYATQRSPLAESIMSAREALRKKRMLAASKPKLNPYRYGVAPDSKDILVEMDALGFYRLCAEAGIVRRGSLAPQQQLQQKAAAALRAKKATKDAQQQILTDPRYFTKLSIMDIFNDIVLKFGSHDPSSNSAMATPTTFTALLVHLAVHRYGNPVLPSSMQPAPVSTLIELLIQKDLTAVCGVVRPPSFFDELCHESVAREVLTPRRSALMLVFHRYCDAQPAAAADGTSVTVSTKSQSLEDFKKMMRQLLLPSAAAAGSTSNSVTLPPAPGLDSTSASVGFDLFNNSHSSCDPEASSAFDPARLYHKLERHFEMIFEQAALMFLPLVSIDDDGAATPSPGPSSPASPAGSLRFSTASLLVGGSTPGDVRITYSEFEICLAAMSVIATPSPFVPLSAKMTLVLDEILSTAAVADILTSAAL